MTNQKEKDLQNIDLENPSTHREDGNNNMPSDGIFPEDMPKEAKRHLQMAMQTTRLVNGPPPSPQHLLFEKFTPEHITKYLDGVQRDDDNAFDLERSNRWFRLFYVLLGIFFVLFLLVYILPKDKEFLDQFLKLTVTFAGGVGSGYGFKSYKDSKK